MRAKIYITLGIIVLILTVPLGICAFVVGHLMCLSQLVSAQCFLVAYGPEAITGIMGIALLRRGIALRGRNKQKEVPKGMSSRHAAELHNLQECNENEDHALTRRHFAVTETPEARASRHQSERSRLLATQRREHRNLNARHAAEPPAAAAGRAERENLLARHAEECHRLVNRQAAEPEAEWQARLAEHEDLIRRQAAEHQNLLVRQASEREFAAIQAAAVNRPAEVPA